MFISNSYSYTYGDTNQSIKINLSLKLIVPENKNAF